MKTKLAALLLALALILPLAAPARAAAPAVQPSPQSFLVDGSAVQAEIYNIDGINYFKLRDVAMLLKDTPARFSVDFDASSDTIRLERGKNYVPDGSELKPGTDKSAACVPSAQALVIDGAKVALTAYNLGGNNFFKLRDLGRALDFYVGYDAEKNAAQLETAYYIRHVDYDEGLPVSIYLETPVFREDSPALNKIEQQLDELREQFVADRVPTVHEYVRSDLESGSESPSAEDPYVAAWSATMFTFDRKLVSFGISYDWYMGGVYDYGMTCYNFSAETGKRLTLADVTNGTEAEIKERIVNALLAQYPGVEEAGVMETPMDAIRGMKMEDFSFYVKDGAVHVFFSKYEITYGAAGAFDVVLVDPAG